MRHMLSQFKVPGPAGQHERRPMAGSGETRMDVVSAQLSIFSGRGVAAQEE